MLPLPQCDSGTLCQAYAIHLLQVGFIDVQAMGLALAALLLEPLGGLHHHKPPSSICQRNQLILLTVMAFTMAAGLTLNMAWLASRSWFHGGTGTGAEVSRECHAIQCDVQFVSINHLVRSCTLMSRENDDAWSPSCHLIAQSSESSVEEMHAFLSVV